MKRGRGLPRACVGRVTVLKRVNSGSAAAKCAAAPVCWPVDPRVGRKRA